MRIIVIGGVAGGMSAATRLRRLDANAEIIVLEKSGHVSYANCGLPYYVGGVIEELGFNAVNLDGGYLTWINSPAGIK